jgi:hypothetical protein
MLATPYLFVGNAGTEKQSTTISDICAGVGTSSKRPRSKHQRISKLQYSISPRVVGVRIWSFFTWSDVLKRATTCPIEQTIENENGPFAGNFFAPNRLPRDRASFVGVRQPNNG